jgi:hypothetical protein
MPFDVLHCFFVFLGGGFGFERAEVPAFSCLRIFLSRIQTVTGFQFPDHADFVWRGKRMPTLPSCISTSKIFKSTFAGPWVTFPVRTSKQELCHGHWTLNPSKLPSESGPKRWVQNS